LQLTLANAKPFGSFGLGQKLKLLLMACIVLWRIHACLHNSLRQLARLGGDYPWQLRITGYVRRRNFLA
jgi:hypothetical protein